MTIGALNKRITIQQPTFAKDAVGTPVSTWVDVATVYAAIWPTSANEQIQANASALIVTHRIRIRYRSVLKAAWRISWAGRYFNIVSIIDSNTNHRFLDLLVKENA